MYAKRITVPLPPNSARLHSIFLYKQISTVRTWYNLLPGKRLLVPVIIFRLLLLQM